MLPRVGTLGALAPAPLTLGEQRERQENRVRSDEARLQLLESRLQARLGLGLG